MKTRVSVLAIALICQALNASAQTQGPNKKALPGDRTAPGMKRELPGDGILPHLDVSNPQVDQKLTDMATAWQSLFGAMPVPKPSPTPKAESEIVTEAQAKRTDTGVEIIMPPRQIAIARPTPRPWVPPVPQHPPEKRSQPIPIWPEESATPPPLWQTEKPRTSPPAQYDTASGVRIYARNIRKQTEEDSITLPSGSIALATTLYGVQVTPGQTRPVAAKVDYAWLGPNSAVVETVGCRVWIPLSPDMNVERLLGTATSLSCKAPNGDVFEIPVRAHIVNAEDEYLGVAAQLVLPGKAKAAALSFLQGGIEAFGNALKAVNIQNSVTTGQVGSPVSSSNVVGNKKEYIAGELLEKSTAKFLDWFIDYYTNLAPQLAVGPGHKIFLALEGEAQIPRVFFGANVSGTSLTQFSDLDQGNQGKGE